MTTLIRGIRNKKASILGRKQEPEDAEFDELRVDFENFRKQIKVAEKNIKAWHIVLKDMNTSIMKVAESMEKLHGNEDSPATGKFMLGALGVGGGAKEFAEELNECAERVTTSSKDLEEIRKKLQIRDSLFSDFKSATRSLNSGREKEKTSEKEMERLEQKYNEAKTNYEKIHAEMKEILIELKRIRVALAETEYKKLAAAQIAFFSIGYESSKIMTSIVEDDDTPISSRPSSTTRPTSSSKPKSLPSKPPLPAAPAHISHEDSYDEEFVPYDEPAPVPIPTTSDYSTNPPARPKSIQQQPPRNPNVPLHHQHQQHQQPQSHPQSSYGNLPRRPAPPDSGYGSVQGNPVAPQSQDWNPFESETPGSSHSTGNDYRNTMHHPPAHGNPQPARGNPPPRPQSVAFGYGSVNNNSSNFHPQQPFPPSGQQPNTRDRAMSYDVNAMHRPPPALPQRGAAPQSSYTHDYGQ